MTTRIPHVALVGIFMLGCGGGASDDSPLVSVPYVPATGATAELPGRVRVVVPPGAATNTGTLNVYASKVSTMPLATAQAVAGFRIELTGQPEGSRLAVPARIIFPFPGVPGQAPAMVDGGLDAASGATVDASISVDAGGATVDASASVDAGGASVDASVNLDARVGGDGGQSVDGGAGVMPAVDTADKFFIAYYQPASGRWMEEPAVVDLQAQTVEVNPLHFSDWWLYILGPGKAAAVKPNFKIWFDPNTNIHALGTNDNYKAAVLIGDKLEAARAAYVTAGFKPFAGRLTVNIEATAKVSEYRWIWKDLVISGEVYGSDNVFLQEIAHELFHSCQANEWGAVAMSGQRWFTESAADWAADKIAFKTGAVGEKVSTQENMKPDYLVKSATTVDEHHEYATANFVDFLVRNGLPFRDAHVAAMVGGTVGLEAAIKTKSSLGSLADAWLRYAAWLAVDPSSPYRLLGLTVFDNVPLPGSRGVWAGGTAAPVTVSARVDPGSLTAGIVAIQAGAVATSASIQVEGPAGLTLAYLLPGGTASGLVALAGTATRSLAAGDVVLAMATSADASKVVLRIGPAPADAGAPEVVPDASRKSDAATKADVAPTKKHGECKAHLCSSWNPDYSAFWDAQRKKGCTTDADCAGIPPLYAGMAQGPAKCSSGGSCLGCDNDGDCADLVSDCRDAVTCTLP